MEHEINENKLLRVVAKVGKGLARKALILWELLKSGDTPPHVKAGIVAALAYLISPVDAIPDVAFPIGYADDAAVLAALIATLGPLVTKAIKAKAEARLDRLNA